MLSIIHRHGNQTRLSLSLLAAFAQSLPCVCDVCASSMFPRSEFEASQQFYSNSHMQSITSWASHIQVCKVKVMQKWPTVVASLMRVACLFAGGKNRLKKIRLHIFDDVGVAAPALLKPKWVGPGLNHRALRVACVGGEIANHYATDIPDKHQRS